MTYDMKAERLRCDGCGKFMAAAAFNKGAGASWAHVPDSDISYEEDKTHCKACTELHGMPMPSQTVNLSVCQGKY